MIDRYTLRYFLAVIDAGNFSKAASQCNVSQPTLSVGIAKLERDLGQPLFRRTNRRVELTTAGARFAVHARRIETEFALAAHAVRETQPASILRLGALVTIPGSWIEAYLSGPGLADIGQRIELVEGRERDLLERLSRGRIDVALSIVRPEQERFKAEILFSEGYALAMPSSHPLAGRTVVAAEELADNSMIVRRSCELLPQTSRHFTARGARPFFPARTLSDDQAIRYVRAGLGVTVMPECFVARGVARPRLADFPYTRDIGLLYAPHVDFAELRQTRALAALRHSIDESRQHSEAGRHPF